MLDALEKNLGVVTSACKVVGLNRSTFYDYYNGDSDFKKDVDDLQNVTLDFVESKLHKNIDNCKETSIIFYLKTKGRKRGYVEHKEVDHTTQGEKININIMLDDED